MYFDYMIQGPATMRWPFKCYVFVTLCMEGVAGL